MSAKDVLKFIKDKDAEFVDLRFTDPRGKLQHLTMDASIVDEDMLEEGVFFDGSSIAGWKAINESDMILKPDASRFFLFGVESPVPKTVRMKNCPDSSSSNCADSKMLHPCWARKLATSATIPI